MDHTLTSSTSATLSAPAHCLCVLGPSRDLEHGLRHIMGALDRAQFFLLGAEGRAPTPDWFFCNLALRYSAKPVSEQGQQATGSLRLAGPANLALAWRLEVTAVGRSSRNPYVIATSGGQEEFPHKLIMIKGRRRASESLLHPNLNHWESESLKHEHFSASGWEPG